ncbi:MAG: hypothetical protein ABI782_08705 [Anaerolineaceae bacterium]
MTNFDGNGKTRNRISGDTVIADNQLSEEALDQVIEDSFPASDPPSHTPTTSLGAPKGVAEEPDQASWMSRSPLPLTAVGAALSIVLVALVTFMWRRRA